jgi:hypothetical protein
MTPALFGKIIFPLHCFFHILEENYRKERKNKIYILTVGQNKQ